MAQVTPEQFYQVATKLCEASTTIEAKLRELDGGLDVGQSAGTYATGGPAWATSLDQSASDVFELGSTTSMAARELGYQVHQAGLNWAHAEDESGGEDQPTPPPPQGSTLSTDRHPSSHAVGGTKAGDEGERRAGIPEGTPKQAVTVTVDGRPVTVVPDLIDVQNENVVEVENTNEIRPYSEQIRAEAEFAKQQGYTMTLIVDHRTQINDPQVQQMIDSGQMELVRKELDDNNDH